MRALTETYLTKRHSLCVCVCNGGPLSCLHLVTGLIGCKLMCASASCFYLCVCVRFLIYLFFCFTSAASELARWLSCVISFTPAWNNSWPAPMGGGTHIYTHTCAGSHDSRHLTFPRGGSFISHTCYFFFSLLSEVKLCDGKTVGKHFLSFWRAIHIHVSDNVSLW